MIIAKALTQMPDYMPSIPPFLTWLWVQSQNNQIFNILIIFEVLNYDREMFGGGFFDTVSLIFPHTTTLYG